jgi:hypothetical protein
MDIGEALTQIQNVRQNMQQIMVGKETAVNLLLIALLSRGHALLEDVPASERPRWSMRWQSRWPFFCAYPVHA